MAITNGYATLDEYKSYVTSRGHSASFDVTDDLVVDSIIEAISRYVDGKTSKRFYPTVEARSYSIPDCNELIFDTDLLEVISIANGDDSSIAASDYNLMPKNDSPKFCLKIKGTSSVTWISDSDGGTEDVIDVTAIWGYHDNYTLGGWMRVGTLGAAIIDTTTLAFTMTSGHTVATGKMLRIDNELYAVSTIATNTITPLKRGDNGSTAAAHSNGTVVYSWSPMADLKNAVLETAMQADKRRFGQSTGESATITGAGVVLTPKDIPSVMAEFIKSHRSYV